MHHIIVAGDNLRKRKNLKKLACVEELFKKANIPYEIHKTRLKGEACNLTQSITSGEGNSVIVMGGDGTLHDVLNGFVNFENNYLGLIPLGTGNDFAAAAGIPLKAKKAAELIISDKRRQIDFIELSSGLRSINAAGMGIDVDVLKRAYAGKNKKKSKYLHALIVSLAKFKSYEYTVKYDGTESRHFGLIAAIGNGVQFGGGIKAFPEAKIDDGYFDLLIVDYLSKFATIGAFIKLLCGKINKIKQVTAVKTKAVSFIPHGGNTTIQADGELYDNVPLEARISDSKLNFYLN